MSKLPKDNKDGIVVKEPQGSDYKDDQALQALNQPGNERNGQIQHPESGEEDGITTSVEEQQSLDVPVQPNNEKDESRPSEQNGTQAESEVHEAIPGDSGDGKCPVEKNWNSLNKNLDFQKGPTAKTPEPDQNGNKEDLFKDLADAFTSQQTAIISHRKTLLIWFICITAMQLFVINVLIFICVFSNKILGDIALLNAVLEFIKFFVGATFLELMGGLLIIVKFVFSREAYDMLKHLTHVEPPANDQT